MDKYKNNVGFSISIVKPNICKNNGILIDSKLVTKPTGNEELDERYRSCVSTANKNLRVLYDFSKQYKRDTVIREKAHDCINRIYRTDFSGKYKPNRIDSRLDNIMCDFYEWWD